MADAQVGGLKQQPGSVHSELGKVLAGLTAVSAFEQAPKWEDRHPQKLRKFSDT